MKLTDKQIHEIAQIKSQGMGKLIDCCLDCDYIGVGAMSTYHAIEFRNHRIRSLNEVQAHTALREELKNDNINPWLVNGE